MKTTITLLSLIVIIQPTFCQFRVYPYIQNPSSDAMTIIWFSEDSTVGKLIYHITGSDDSVSVISNPLPALTLDYSLWEDTTFFNGSAPDHSYKHRLRLSDLIPSTSYTYKVYQDSRVFTSTFKTAPDAPSAMRFIFYSDSETEPESTGKYTDWGYTDTTGSRVYLIDQTTGYRNNLLVIKSRSPDLIFVAGDLVESGGEQRDWDEFWNHNTNVDSSISLAGRIPVMAVPGNHEYFEGPYLGRYNQPGSERAIQKFLSYFENPENGSENKFQEGRYYCLKYGNITFIAIDACNNGVNGTSDDTNFYLTGESDAGGGNAPDFGPGSAQYVWLENCLHEAQKNSVFTFVIFHHAPYSSGPHGFASGTCDTCDNQSGQPVRILTELFMKYGVDAVISGHDEIWERSSISGNEIFANDSTRPHTIQFYDVGIGGDGLRGPYEGIENLYRQYMVHSDSPEIWLNGIFSDGGKHYGHLEMNIYEQEKGLWIARLTPVYVLPLYNEPDLGYSGFERRTYDDEIILTQRISDTVVSISEDVDDFSIVTYPNPFRNFTIIKFYFAKPSSMSLSVYDLQGRLVSTIGEDFRHPGWHEIMWNGEDNKGSKLGAGVYLLNIRASGINSIRKIMVIE